MLKVKTYRPSKTMDVVNAVKMIVLVWTFASVCEASDDSCTFSSSCADVTGTVHEELTLTCSISLNCTKGADQCCMILYMFKDENTTVIYKKEFPNETCEREIKATCVYKPSENITAKFTLFFQTSCGTKATEFIVNVTGSGGDKTVITDTVQKGSTNPQTLVDSRETIKQLIVPQKMMTSVNSQKEHLNNSTAGLCSSCVSHSVQVMCL